MGFVRPSGRERGQIALFGALVAVALLLAQPVGAALDDQARAEIHHQRGAHALRAGNPDEAIEWFDKALALDPERVETLALKARALLEDGRAAEAEQVTEQLRTLRPGDSDVTFLLAMTAYRQQDWITARRYLEEARSQHPGDARVRLYLGRTYQELGEDTAAEQELMEAARIDPDYRAPAAYRLGILHLQRSEPKQAKRQFQQVRELDPGSELAKSAEIYLKLMAGTEQRRISYWAKLAADYDSNMTLAGGDDLVNSSDESGYRGSLEIGTNIRLLRWRALTLRSGFTNYVSYHNHEHEFDIQQIRPWVLATVQPLEMLAFDLRLTHERVYRNYHSFKAANYVSPAIRFLPAPGWVTRLFVEYEDRNYHDAFETIRSRDRDGWVGIAGLDQYIPLPNPLADGVAYMRLGYRFRNEDSGGRHFDSQSHKPVGTLGVALPWGMDFHVEASWERRQFRDTSVFEAIREIVQQTGDLNGDMQLTLADLPAFALQPVGCRFSPAVEDFSRCRSNDRLDKITQVHLRLRKAIGRSWSMETYYRWTDWESNTDEFNFNRHIVGLAATFRR